MNWGLSTTLCQFQFCNIVIQYIYRSYTPFNIIKKQWLYFPVLYNISLLQSLLLKLAIFKILFRKLHLFETAFSPCHTHLLATKSSYLLKKCSMICSVQVLRKEKEIQETVTSETKNPYAVIRNDHRKYLSNIEKQTSLKMCFRLYALYKFRKKWRLLRTGRISYNSSHGTDHQRDNSSQMWLHIP